MRAYTADMIPGGASPVINVSQYDNDYAVTVTLIEGAEIYTPPSGATIMVEGTKPDGNGFSYACTYQGNVVTVPIYTQMTAVAGRFPIELVVYQSGLRVGSCNITLAVERAPLDSDEIISDSDIPAIIALAQSQADAAASSAASAETAKDAAMDAAQDAIDAAQELQTAIQFNAALIHETASGAVASFADGADDIPMQSLVAEITPVQSGSGDPSPTNVRPISGRTGLTVTRCGRNLGKITLNSIADADIGDGSYTLNGLTFSFTKVSDNGVSEIVVNGTPTARATSMLNRNLLAVLPPGRYRLSGCPSGGALSKYRLTCWDNTVSATVANDFGSGATFELVEGHNVNFAIDISASMAGETISNLVFKPMIRPASDSNDAYEPYNGTSFPITWESIAGTVYGGTLDVVSGVLTVTHTMVTLDGDTNKFTNKGSASAYDEYYFAAEDGYTFGKLSTYVYGTELANSGFLCSAFPIAPGGSTVGDYATAYIGGAGMLQPRIRFTLDRSLNTLALANAYLAQLYAANTPVQIVYKLATPQTYQLTPTEVRTLLGVNNLWSDSGDVSVEYIADTKMYIDKKIAELQALVLEN